MPSFGIGSLAIGVPTNSVDHSDISRLLPMSPYSFALVIRNSWSAFWPPAAEGHEMVSSPLVVGSNALIETAARSDGIVALCGGLSRADFTFQEGAVGLDIAVELASPIGPGWQKLLGHLKEAILPAQLPADAVLIRLSIPMDIRWRYQPCEWRKNLNRMPANSCL